MQVRCPNCGNYWTMPVSTPPQGVWRTLAILWLAVCLLAALLAFILTVQTIQTLGAAEGWSVGLLVVAPLIVGSAPLFIVQNLHHRRETRLALWQCRSCGFQWKP